MKKTNTNRIISSIIIAMMVVTSLIIPVSADETEATPTLPLVYQSSIGFTTESSTWGTDGVWSATEFNATDNTYTPMSASTDVWAGTNGTKVDADEIMPVTGNDNAENYAIYGGAKTFTAPYSGAITISYASVTHPSAANYTGAVVKSAWNQGMKYRITKQSAGCMASKIYPAASTYIESGTNNSTIGYVLVASDTTHTVSVSKGDKLHFEVMRMDANQPWQGVYCDPIITYTELIDGNETRNTFTSSENFNRTNDDGTWDKGIWSAEWKDSSANNQYKLMTTKHAELECYTADGNVSVFAGQIRPPYANAANIKAHTAVLTFTAPKSGKISISHNAQLKLDWDGKVDFTITRRNAESTAIGTVVSKIDIDGTTAVDGPTASIYVAKGDKISFEVKLDDTFTDDTPAQSWATLTCDPIITYDETVTIPDVEDRTTFTSSDYFDNTSGDGTWDSGIWLAQTYNPNTDTYATITTGAGSGEDGYFGELSHRTRVMAKKIMPATANKDNVGDNYFLSAVKTFVAPMDGAISVSYNGTVGLTGGGTAKYRITVDKNSVVSNIIPASGYATTTTTADISENLKFNLIVKKGDKINFEAAWPFDVKKDNWQGLYCDPVITYTAIMTAPETRNEFRSAEFYDTNGETAKWDNGVWQAWFYDWNKEGATTERDKYQLMKGTREDDGIVKWANNEKSEAGDYNWNGNAAQIGPEFMRVELIPYESGKVPATEYEKTWSGETYSYPIGRDYPVKVFKAPKTGVVSIGAHVMAAPAADKGVRVRIMKMNASGGEPVQVWPYSGFKTYAAGETINFTPVKTALAEGDMLMFECPYIYGTGFESPYSGSINWDPTITYTDGVAINNIGTEFKSGEDIVTGVTNIATAANLTATIPVYSGTAFEKAIVVVGIYDSNDMLVRVGMSEDISISATEPNNVPVTFGAAASEIESGSIKVFLWEGLSSLAPVAAAMPIQ